MALNHDLRVDLLRLLAVRNHSKTTAAKALGWPTQNVAYHLDILVECEMVEKATSQQVGSVLQKFYKLRPCKDLTQFDTSDLPQAVRAGLNAAFVDFFFESLGTYLGSGAAEKEGACIEGGPLTLDLPGWRAAAKAVRAIQEKLADIEAESRRRMQRNAGIEPVPSIFAIAFFQPPQPRT
jgi:hypothetical protein